MKKLMKVLGLFTLNIISLSVIAESELQFPAEFSLKSTDIKSTLQNVIPKMIGEGGVLAPSWTLDKPYRSEFTNIHWSGKVKMDWEATPKNSVRFVGEISEPTIYIDKVSVHDTISRRISGVDVVVRVDAECGPIKITSKENWAMLGEVNWVVESSKLKTKVSALEFASGATWDVEIGNCVGPQGIEVVLEEAFIEFVSDRSRAQQLIFTELSKYIQSHTSRLEDSLYETLDMEVSKGLKMGWQTFNVHGNESGDLKLFGLLKLSSQGEVVKAIPYETPTSFGELRSQTGLVLSKEHLGEVVNFLSQTGFLDLKMSSKSIPGLSSLLSSRFLQFFVWPDLWNFPRGVELLFKNKFLGNIKVPGLYNIRDGISIGVQAKSQVGIEAPFKSKFVPYIDLNTDLNGEIEVLDGKDRIEVSFYSKKLPLQFMWRREFSMLRSITRWISTNIISSRILSALQDTRFELEKKSWNMGDFFSVKMSGFSSDGKNVLIQFDQNK